MVLIFAFIFSEYLHCIHYCMHIVYCEFKAKKHRSTEAQRHRGKNFQDKFLPNRWTFINKKSTFIHNFWFPATFITDKFWSDSRLRRSHRGDVFSILLFLFLNKNYINTTKGRHRGTEAKRHRGKEAHLQQHRGTAAQRHSSTEAQRQRGTEAKKHIYSSTEAKRQRSTEAQRQKLWGQVSPQPLNFY